MSEAKTIPAKYIFLDIVGFTHNRSAEAQSHIVDVLNHIVESCMLEHKVPKDRVLFLPASDGICVALLNIESPYDIHLSIALSIIREVAKYSAATENEMRKFEVRVGLNSHIDNLITDINGHQNIAGAGVNTASRLMNLADGNQILVSQPVFEALRYHEKYLSSFKTFRAKIRHGLELPVYQFTASGHNGLNTSVPSSLQGSEKPAPQPPPQPTTAKPLPTPAPTLPSLPTRDITANRVGSVEFVKKPTDKQMADTWSSQTASMKADETQSYLKGILPEPEKTETTTTGWIKSKAVKTEPLPFLEQAESPRQNRSFVWAALILLLVGASFGTWFWMQGEQMANAPTPATTTASDMTSVATTETPASTPAPAVPGNTPAQAAAVTQTTSPSNPSNAFKPNTATPDNKVKNDVELPTPSRVNPPARRAAPAPPPRPVVQRTVAQRPQPPTKTQAKRQTVKANKPQTSKRITIDDLINDN